MSFQKLLDTGQFLIVAQLEPPKGADASAILQCADALKGRAHAVIIPEMSGAIMRMSSLGASCLLKQKGIEVITSVNSRDRNRLSLQAEHAHASCCG